MLATAIIYAILIAVAIALLFYIEIALCSIVDVMYQAIEKFAGISQVRYGNKSMYLIEVFFSKREINNVYWAMALIGTALLIGFTIVAVIKKMFDTEDKVKNTFGGIIGSALKALLIILSMNFILSATITATNVLIQRISYAFNNSSELGKIYKITYTDEMFARMAKVLDTIGNYSLTPSRTNRYNVNSCFNDIRQDLKWLDDELVFYFDYSDYAEQYGASWQSVLEEIALSAYLGEDQDVNVYNESITRAIGHAFDALENNNSFYPMKSYSVTPTAKEVANGEVPMGAMLFMSASFDAAQNRSLNGVHASFDDPLRSKYISGKRNYKDFSSIESDFDFFTGFNHLTLIISAIFIAKEFLAILINCIARIFNMLLLYLAAPPFIATMPMDDGAKFKQWTLAFTIQSLSVIGQLITIRLYAMFIPVVMSGDLIIFENSTANALCKVIFMVGAAVTVREATGLFTGILAEQAGQSAIRAGDVGGKVAKAATEMAGGLVKAGAGLAVAGVGLGVNTAAAAISGPKHGSGGSGGSGGGGGGGGGGQGGPAQLPQEMTGGDTQGNDTQQGGDQGGTGGTGETGPVNLGGDQGGTGGTGGTGKTGPVNLGGDQGGTGGIGGTGETGPVNLGGDQGGTGGTGETGPVNLGGDQGGTGGTGETGPVNLGGDQGGEGTDGSGGDGQGMQGPANLDGQEDSYDDNPADEEFDEPGRGAYAKDAFKEGLKDIGYAGLAAANEGLSAMSRVAGMAMTGDAENKGFIQGGKKGEDFRRQHEQQKKKTKDRYKKTYDKAKKNFETKNRQIPTQSHGGPNGKVQNSAPQDMVESNSESDGNVGTQEEPHGDKQEESHGDNKQEPVLGNKQESTLGKQQGPVFGNKQEDSYDDNPADEEFEEPGSGDYAKDEAKEGLKDLGYAGAAVVNEGLSGISKVMGMAMTGDPDNKGFIQGGLTGEQLKKKQQLKNEKKEELSKKTYDKAKKKFEEKNHQIPTNKK